MFLTRRTLWFALVLVGIPGPTSAQETEPIVDPAVFQEMQWRSIGPFRGGRSVASAGVPSDPRTYYMGTVGGGVWKTTDAGITWLNVTDGQLLGRCNRGGRVGPECRLRRHG